MRKLSVDPDIRRARTLPPEIYSDPVLYDLQRDRVMRRGWQVVADAASLREPGQARPVTLLEGCLDEPLLLTRDGGGALHGLSNVCTHRGNLIAAKACKTATLRCRYHGRRFGLDGRFAFMPEMDGALGFPSPADDLPRVPLERWGPLLFASLEPAAPFDAWMGPVRDRLAFVDLDALVLDGASSRDYEVAASWALYCDNYLEGFHIPFVHHGLAEELDYEAYATETFAHGSLQIGVAKGDEHTFDLPASHPDHGRRVAAYYAWLFPATMLNLYPWGLSVNVVRPLGPDRTRVSFLSFVLDPSKRAAGAGADLHRVELEDEAIVEDVQRGVRSRLYRGGRFSPSREVGVHHFHRLLAASLA